MSSIKVESEVSGEDIRNLTMQWHCGTAVRGSSSRERSERTPFEIPSFIDSAMHGICMLAGGATTVGAFIAYQSGWIPTEEIVALIF